MYELNELRDTLCAELKEYGKKDLTAGSLDIVDKLCHAIKNLDKILAKEDCDKSYGMRGKMGRYSRNDGLISELHSLMQDASDEMTRTELQKLITKMESM